MYKGKQEANIDNTEDICNYVYPYFSIEEETSYKGVEVNIDSWVMRTFGHPRTPSPPKVDEHQKSEVPPSHKPNDIDESIKWEDSEYEDPRAWLDSGDISLYSPSYLKSMKLLYGENSHDPSIYVSPDSNACILDGLETPDHVISAREVVNTWDKTKRSNKRRLFSSPRKSDPKKKRSL